jgi:hypothetical protein
MPPQGPVIEPQSSAELEQERQALQSIAAGEFPYFDPNTRINLFSFLALYRPGIYVFVREHSGAHYIPRGVWLVMDCCT